MRVYRYEMKDGGGPWFTRDGLQRESIHMPIKFADNVLYGCTSLQALFDYFKEREREISLEDCEVKVYEVPEYDVIKAGKNQVVFPKTYEPIY